MQHLDHTAGAKAAHEVSWRWRLQNTEQCPKRERGSSRSVHMRAIELTSMRQAFGLVVGSTQLCKTTTTGTSAG
eukprot:2703125-Prymnesium_polylepis.1